MNKNIWMYWNTGVNSMDELAKSCVESWKRYNPDWNVIIVTDDNIDNYADPNLLKNCPTPAGKSDILRINLLQSHGGIWSDVDVWCNNSIDSWLHNHTSDDFFALQLPKTRRNLCSWFLYSTKDNVVTTEWTKRVNAYWSDRHHVSEYYWFHYMFGQILKTNKQINNIWNNCKHINGLECAKFRLTQKHVDNNLPHKTRFRLDIIPSQELKSEIENRVLPVYKLNRKTSYPSYQDGCIWNILKECLDNFSS